MPKMVFISSCGAFDRYLIRRVAEQREVAHIVSVTWDDAQVRKMSAAERITRAVERRLYYA